MPTAECPLCSAPLVPEWRSVGIWRCRSCDLRLRHPLPDVMTLDHLYHAAWESPRVHSAETGGTTDALARDYVRHLLVTVGLSDLDGLRLVDLGAGDGSMSRALLERGAEVHAVDPFAYDELRAQGIDAYRSIGDLPAHAPFDGAVCLEVIEHLTDPWIQLKKLRAALRSSAWLLVTTPNAAGLNARLNADRWREVRKPGHIVWFAPRTLEGLLQQTGFERWRRLEWPVDDGISSASLPRRLLQLLGLDGSLRYLAYAA